MKAVMDEWSNVNGWIKADNGWLKDAESNKWEWMDGKIWMINEWKIIWTNVNEWTRKPKEELMVKLNKWKMVGLK